MACEYHQKRPLTFDNLDPGCQFVGETEFFGLDGRTYCRFHAPMEATDSNDNKKARNVSEIEDFKNHVYTHINNTSVIDLTGVVFPGHIDFSRYNKGSALLKICFFKAAFEGGANFGGAVFKNLTSFREAEFKVSVVFAGARFEESVDFTKATFESGADFDEVVFEKTASFHNATFEFDANFEKAAFGGNARFDMTTFGNDTKFTGSPDAETKPTNSFHKITFKKAIFGKNTVLDKAPIFSNRRFLDKAIFKETTFVKAPEFYNSQLHQDTDFTGAKFPDTESDHAARSYRTLKLAMGNVRARDEEAMFYALEQKSLRHRHETPKPVKIMSWFYEMLSDYGRSFTLPVLWLFLVFIFFTAEYSILANRHSPLDLGKSALFAVDQMIRPFKALSFDYYTKNSGIVGDLFKEYPIAVRLLAALQTIATIGLLTLFVLAVRRRFRLN